MIQRRRQQRQPTPQHRHRNRRQRRESQQKIDTLSFLVSCFITLIINVITVQSYIVPSNMLPARQKYHYQHHRQNMKGQLFWCAIQDRFSRSRSNIYMSSKIQDPYNGDDDDEEVFFVGLPSRQNNKKRLQGQNEQSKEQPRYFYYLDMDDLSPPSLDINKDSILFSPNPSTKRNNDALVLWKFCKQNLPPVFTGAWPWRGNNGNSNPRDGSQQKGINTLANDNPFGGFYNMLFVRLPVILAGMLYVRNLLDGYPLVLNIGLGPFEPNPLIVFAVLAIILA